ncbi:MAG: hypothetical protein EZS28_026421 [Streblomastix strix]|uniref:Uncharacterized protein n=1 Tax=Streblomastix strix TaxID=222440 RepID=A0A5J4V6K4_9EUKA|nr:MAG: hypothetical protein EZS28_026421 [Streblomastix strix]
MLQWSHVTRNSTIAFVRTDTKITKSRPSQPASRPIIRNRDGTRAIDSAAGDVYTNTDNIAILFRTTDTKTVDIIAIPGIWHIPGNVTILRFSVNINFFQQTQSSGYSIQLYGQPSFTEGLPQFMQNSPNFGLQQTQQSNLLTPLAQSSAGHPSFQSSFQSNNPEQSSQQYTQQPTIRPPTLIQQQQIQTQEPVYVNGRLLDSPGIALRRRIEQDLQPLWNKEISQRTDQSLFTPIDPQNQQQTLISKNLTLTKTSGHKGVIRQDIYRFKGFWRTSQKIQTGPHKCPYIHLETCQT